MSGPRRVWEGSIKLEKMKKEQKKEEGKEERRNEGNGGRRNNFKIGFEKLWYIFKVCV